MDSIPMVSDRCNKSDLIESLKDPCLSTGINAVTCALATHATNACIDAEPVIMSVAEAVLPTPNSSKVVPAETNVASNTNNGPAFDFDSDAFFHQFLGDSPSAAKAA